MPAAFWIPTVALVTAPVMLRYWNVMAPLDSMIAWNEKVPVPEYGAIPLHSTIARPGKVW